MYFDHHRFFIISQPYLASILMKIRDATCILMIMSSTSFYLHLLVLVLIYLFVVFSITLMSQDMATSISDTFKFSLLISIRSCFIRVAESEEFFPTPTPEISGRPTPTPTTQNPPTLADSDSETLPCPKAPVEESKA